MRMVARIATAGVSGLSRFPVMETTIEECLNEKGELVESKIRAALNIEGVTFSSKDNLPVMHFCAEFMKQVRSVVDQMAKKDGSNVRTGATSECDSKCDRRRGKGLFAYVRVDVDFVGDHLRARLGYSNPKNVVGFTELFAKDFAEMCARILNYMAGEFARVAGIKVELVGGENCEDIYEEARQTEDWIARKKEAVKERDALAEKREHCPYRRLGFCSPVQVGCPCLKDGYCVEPRLPPEFDKECRE